MAADVTNFAGIHDEQRPHVSLGPAASAVAADATTGRARWTVPAAEFKRAACRFDPVAFAAIQKLSEREVTLDACANSESHALAAAYSTAAQFEKYDCTGHHVWLDAPPGATVKLLEHYLQCKAKSPATTSAVVVVPKDAQYKQVTPLLHGMRLLKTYSRGVRLYNAVSGSTPQPGIPHAVQVWYDPPAMLAAGRLLQDSQSAVTIASDSVNAMRFIGDLAGCKVQVHADTEATHSFVAAHVVERAGLAVTPAARTVALADGRTVRVQGLCRARLHVGKVADNCQFYVLPLDSAYDVLLGQDWLKRKAAILDFGKMTVSIRISPITIETTTKPIAPQPGGGETPRVKDEDIRISALQLKRMSRKKGTEMFLVVLKRVDEADAKCAALNASASEEEPLIADSKLQKLLDKYKVVFSELPAGVIHRPGLPEMTIDFEEGKQPPKGFQYRLSKPEKDELQRQLTLALEKGWVEPSSAPFGAPVLFAKKKNGGLRMCIDYRAVNRITQVINPLPRIDDLLDMLNGATVFSGLDLASGYWQIPLKEEHRYRSTFLCPQGAYQWKVMPFGLANAPGVFARTMHTVFSDMIGKFVLVYLDDILIFSKTPEEHEQHLELVLERLKQHQFYAQRPKCTFFVRSCEFLGHIVSGEGISVDPRKVKIVQDWPVPTDASQVMSFLGLANFFRRFIHAYSSIAKPLHELTHKNAVWKWTSQHQAAFHMLKEKLVTAPVLKAPDFSNPRGFQIIADASDYCIGAILLQDDHPIAFESKKLSPAQVNYVTAEKELLAVMHALTVWRCYVDGSKVTIYSDHEPLKYLKTKQTLLPREVRWSQFLERFDYTWEYRVGRLNAADPLSRVTHSSVDGSGTGSLTGKAVASETVLDYLAALRSSSRVRKAKAPYSPPASPKKQRQQQQQLHAADADADEPTVLSDVAVPVSSQVAAALREEIAAGYKLLKESELTATAARYSLRQSEEGLWCHGQQVYVPNFKLQQKIIAELHDTPYSGHKGVTKTLAAVQRLYWWPGLRSSVNNFVTTCASCQRNKVQGKKPIGMLQPLEVPAAPWAEVSMDYITGLPTTVAGNDAVMVFCDRLTKMVHFAACTKTIDAEGSAKLFVQHVFAHHGLPVSIISDRDTRFKSEFWSALMSMLQVNHKMSSAFHPQTDGQTERVNRVLEEYLRHYVSPTQDDWDQWLPLAEFAYNNSVHEAVKETPFFLNYGLHPRVPGAVRTQAQTVAPATEFAERMQQIIEKAKMHLEGARQRACRIANPSRREAAFKVGDKVLLSSKNVALKTPGVNKLLPKFLGPFTVKQVLSPVSYRLDLPSSMKCHNVFHASLLLEYKSDGREQPPPPALEFDDGEGGVWLEIDEILAHRKTAIGRRDVMQYLVKWKGHGPECNEWRDEAGVTAVATDAYWAKVGRNGSGAPSTSSQEGRKKTKKRSYSKKPVKLAGGVSKPRGKRSGGKQQAKRTAARKKAKTS
eukprot:GHUV01001775.1.p1 GENE.GHUV01001775.1~~GHUV01001775.1.p1  ORF type:complete len:1469 (+),score=368.37 GHUV01001775.1:420-4826(+)